MSYSRAERVKRQPDRTVFLQVGPASNPGLADAEGIFCSSHPPTQHMQGNALCLCACTLLIIGGHEVALSPVQVGFLMPNHSYTPLARSACGSPVARGTCPCSLPARPSSAATGATASSLQYVATPLYAMRCDVLRLKHESLHSAVGCSDNSGTAGRVTSS